MTAALDVIDAAGLEGLTMSALAKRLGVGTMSLYWYFPSKDDLLGAVASRVQQLLAADDEGMASEWDDALFAYFTRLRRELLGTPGLARLLVAHGRLATSLDDAAPILDRLERQLRSMVEAGVPLLDAVSGLEALSQYALGFVMRESSRRDAKRQTQLWLDAIDAAGEPERYELVRGVVARLAEPGGDELFEEGLRLILSGLRARISPPSTDD